MDEQKYFDWDKREIHDFLLNNERISTEGMELVLDKCFKLKEENPDCRIVLQESGEAEPLGVIIDVIETSGDEDVIGSETFWYEDIN